MRGSRVALVAVGLVVGCEAPSRPPAVRIETGAPGYPLGAPVTYTVTNLGGSPVYLASCCEVVTAVDRWQDGRWPGTPRGSFCLAICPMAPRALGPRASYRGTVGVADTGRYRLHLGIARSGSGAPDWRPTSNPFEVR